MFCFLELVVPLDLSLLQQLSSALRLKRWMVAFNTNWGALVRRCARSWEEALPHCSQGLRCWSCLVCWSTFYFAGLRPLTQLLDVAKPTRSYAIAIFAIVSSKSWVKATLWRYCMANLTPSLCSRQNLFCHRVPLFRLRPIFGTPPSTTFSQAHPSSSSTRGTTTATTMMCRWTTSTVEQQQPTTTRWWANMQTSTARTSLQQHHPVQQQHRSCATQRHNLWFNNIFGGIDASKQQVGTTWYRQVHWPTPPRHQLRTT